MAGSARESAMGKGNPVSLLEVLDEANHAAALAPDHEAMAIALGLPLQGSAHDQCALYFTAVAMKDSS